MEQHQHYQSLQDQAYNALRSKIIYAELKPGTRLSAIGLEKETGIGRTPIRESFVRLREQELVETRPKSGTYVSKISMERAENACFLREKLERSVLIKCCSAASPEQKQRIEQILAESESLDHSETRRFFDLDNLFHETCFEIAGRHMLWDWMKSINTHFERYNWLRMVSQDLDWEPIRRQHRRILEAIKGGDTDTASYLAETHLHLMPEEQGPVIALHPDYFELSDVRVLSVCPQGLVGSDWDRRNLYHSGYFTLDGDICSEYELGKFYVWDAGFDFYAPQTFSSEDGRRILIGWMSLPGDESYGNDPTVAEGWQHCLTVPCELTVGADGVVLQQPAREIEHHYVSVRVGEGSLEVADDTCFDVKVDGVGDAFAATVDGELRLSFLPAEGELPARFEMRFANESRASAGCGRTVRWEPVDEVRNVRIVGDVSSVEVFVNDGSLVFSTRIYPEAYGVAVDAPGANVNYHALSI